MDCSPQMAVLLTPLGFSAGTSWGSLHSWPGIALWLFYGVLELVHTKSAFPSLPATHLPALHVISALLQTHTGDILKNYGIHPQYRFLLIIAFCLWRLHILLTLQSHDYLHDFSLPSAFCWSPAVIFPWFLINSFYYAFFFIFVFFLQFFHIYH